MKNQYTDTTTVRRPLNHDQSTVITRTQPACIANKISIGTSLFICIALILMTGCANYGSARLDDTKKLVAKPVYLVTEEGNQCAALNNEITDTLEYAKKFNHSKYASHYHAMTREKLFAIENRARQARCTYSSQPANTRLHNLSSI